MTILKTFLGDRKKKLPLSEIDLRISGISNQCSPDRAILALLVRGPESTFGHHIR